MTTNVTSTVLQEGSKKFIVQFNLTSDGTTGELINQVVFDPQNQPTLFDLSAQQPPVAGQVGNQVVYYPQQTLQLPLDPATQLSIRQIWYSCVWFDVAVSWNATQPTLAWVLNRDAYNYMDFRYFGGIKDKSTADHDQKLLFTTNGIDGIASSIGTIIIEFQRD